jgi:hypothetical protein
VYEALSYRRMQPPPPPLAPSLTHIPLPPPPTHIHLPIHAHIPCTYIQCIADKELSKEEREMLEIENMGLLDQLETELEAFFFYVFFLRTHMEQRADTYILQAVYTHVTKT